MTLVSRPLRTLLTLPPRLRLTIFLCLSQYRDEHERRSTQPEKSLHRLIPNILAESATCADEVRGNAASWQVRNLPKIADRRRRHRRRLGNFRFSLFPEISMHIEQRSSRDRSMRRTPTTIASINLILAVMLSAAGLFNKRVHTDREPLQTGSPNVLLVARQH
jgi:hypothetical protein